jgi:hypothetical protein
MDKSVQREERAREKKDAASDEAADAAVLVAVMVILLTRTAHSDHKNRTIRRDIKITVQYSE